MTEFATAVIRGRRKLNIYLEEEEDSKNFAEKLEKLETNKNNQQSAQGGIEEGDQQYAGAPETKLGQDRKIAKREYTDRRDWAVKIPMSWHEHNPVDQRETWLRIRMLDGLKEEFAEPNVIQQNYNQGILIVEGSWAAIVGNKID